MRADERPGTTEDTRLEAWLRSPWRRLALIGGVVVVLTTLSTNVAVALVEEEGARVDWSGTFVRNLVTIGLWGLLFEPLRALVLLVGRLLRPWWAQLLVHLPLSLGAVLFVSAAQKLALDGLGLAPPEPWSAGPGVHAPKPPPDEHGPPRGGPRGQPPGPPNEVGPRRPVAGLFVYWSLVALVFGLEEFLRRRSDGRTHADVARRARELERDLLEARLTNLRRQLQPHFLFNALHSVGGLVRAGQGTRAVEALEALGGLLRALLAVEDRPLVPLAEELDLADRYLRLEAIRLGERLQVATRLDADAARVPVPALILLPLVENAVTHGIAPRIEGGRVEIEARLEAGHLVIDVRDSGAGFPPEVLRAGRGSKGERPSIGLANTRGRLRTLDGPEAALELSNDGVEGRGAHVRLRLPLSAHGTEVGA